MKINKEVLECWKLTEKQWKRYRYKRKNLCNHRYPYFTRWWDDWSKSGKMIERHCYCFICEKEYIIKLNPNHMDVPRMNFGLEKGRETIDKLRKKLPKMVIKYIWNVRKNIQKV